MKPLLRPFTTLFACLALSLTTGPNARAQKVDDFTFIHLGSAEGLTSQRIYHIRQTDDGALWWSDKNGVERYNGVRLKHYPIGNTQLFSHSGGRIFKFVRQVVSQKNTEQKTGIPLMVFDNKGGIFVYDEPSDCFVLHTDLAAMMGGDVLLNEVLMTDSGAWLAMREGVWFLKKDNKEDDSKLLIPIVKDNYANIILQSKHGFLLCLKDGVLSYQIQHHAVPKVNMKLHKLTNIAIESGYYDNKYETVWLGSYQDGLHILRHTGSNDVIDHCTFPGIAMQNPIRCIYPFNDNVMLVGIDGLGVYKADRHPSSSRYSGTLLFNANEGSEGVLHGNGIYSMIRDTWGNIIIGSYSGGIDIARPVGSTPAIYRHQRGVTQSLQNDRVNCVAQFPDGMMAMGTDNGVSLLNPKTGQWQHLCHGAVVLSLCLTPQGTMLVATYGKGVYEITEQGSTRQRFTASDGILKDDHVYKLFYDHRGSLWIGCLDGDLVEYSATSVRYYHINNVQDIQQLPDKRIVIGTASGAWLIDTMTNGVSKLDYAPKGATDVNYYVNTLYIDDDGLLWIGSDGGGIYIYNVSTGECRQLTTADGLPSNVVSSICKDVKGRLLVTTERGLAFAHNETASQFVNVNYCYGIEREYSSRSVVRLQNDFMLYGTTSGALLINPENIQKINYTAQLRLTGVSCNDSSAQFRQQIHEMLQQHDLRLSYSQRTFELYFEGINLRNQFDIVYQYQMDGGAWSHPDDQQYIRFTNLEPGSHGLRVRCVSKTCGEVLSETELEVTIGQPWWNSWWMWVVYSCLLIMAFYGAWRIYELHTKYMRLVVSNPNLGNTADIPNMQEPATDTSAEENNEEGRHFIDKATQLVVENIADSEFTIDRLCREMAMSRTLFYVKLKSYTGKSPQDFIRIIRLERAAALLRSGHPVTDASIMSGFDNPKYFSTVFKKYFGTSPSKYR